MFDKFEESFGTRGGESIFAALTSPAVIFWLGGLLAWASRHGWSGKLAWFDALSPIGKDTVFVVGILLIAASSASAKRLSGAFLAFLAGFWPSWFFNRGARLRDFWTKRRSELEAEFQRLMGASHGTMTQEQKSKLSAVDHELRRIPEPGEILPMSLGNVLRAAQARPRIRYGIDAAITWPAFMLLLADGPRQTVVEARKAMNASAEFALWSLLFLIWTFLNPWGALVSVIGLVASYNWLLADADAYGELLAATYDVYRWELYKAMRFPLPRSADERQEGEALTRYFWRGSNDPRTLFR